MYLIAFAIIFQFLVILERILHILILLFFSTKRSALKQYGGRIVVASIFDFVVVVATLPIQIVFVALGALTSNIIIGFCLLLLVGGLAIASEISGPLIAYIVNSYNAGIGIALNKYIVTPFFYTELLLADVIPLYNSITWFLGRILFQVLELIEQNFDVFPELASNVALIFTSLGRSGASVTEKLLRCWSYNGDMSCVGNSLAVSFDVMTPSVYVQASISNIHGIFSNICNPVLIPFEIIIYPLLDVNLYMGLHSIVNSVWSLLCGTWIQRHQRCEFGKEGVVIGKISQEEASLMCFPDFNNVLNWVGGAITALGRLIDNWADITLLLVEKAVGLNPGGSYCDSARGDVTVAWQAAGEILSTTLPRQVVGLTDNMYAITDGVSTVYRSLVQRGQFYYAIENWPVEIEPRYGVAAVSHSTLFDPDNSGDGRTGLLGCRCEDGSEGIEVVCTSVPFQKNPDDSPETYNISTIHRIQFASGGMMVQHMSCAKTKIKVASLRFSRKRMSIGNSAGYESILRDEFDTLGDFGQKMMLYTADAAIYIMPLCSLTETDPACVPNTISCFPFCLGLHTAGQTGQNITAYNARRWRESVNVQQVDCLTEQLTQDDTCSSNSPIAYSDIMGFQYQGQCDLSLDCRSNDFVGMQLPITGLGALDSTDALLNEKAATDPYIRLESQPFVMAGDVMLFIESNTNDDSRSLIISRLYDNNKGDYTLSNEKLTLLNQNIKIPVKQCEPDENSCHADCIRTNSINEPQPDRLEPLRSHAVAVSEWGVHWADNPDNSVLGNEMDWCYSGKIVTGITVVSSYRRPRIWTVKSMRVTSYGNLEILPQTSVGGETDNPLTSYMIVPDWHIPVQDGILDCNQEVNLKIVDLEYLNPQNILVTVLRSTLANYDRITGTVCEGCDFDYSFYYLHPNLHKCLEPSESSDNFYTCWRRQDEGMFQDYSVPEVNSAGLGLLCPAVRRMPQLGALGAAVGNGGLEALRIFIDSLFTLPAAIGFGVDVFKLRLDYLTYHPVLDSSGTSLFAVEPMLIQLDMAAFHLTNSFVRIMAFFEGDEGYESVKPIIIGTAKVLQYSGDSILLEGPFLSMFSSLKKIPVAKTLGSAGSVLDSGPMGGKQSKMKVSVQMISSAFTSSFRYVVRVTRPICTRLLKTRLAKGVKTGRKIGMYGNILNFFPSILAESQGEFKRSMTNNMMIQCDGLANILGTTNPVALSIRHACLVIPETLNSVFETFVILVVDYPAVGCACGKSQERNPSSVIESECLLSSTAVKNRVQMQELRRQGINNDARQSMCFTIMDAINLRFENAWANVFSRMAKFGREFERIIDFMIGIFGLDGGNCDDYAESPYVMSIVPYPIDYFAGCVHTYDCRSRCGDEMTAFDATLLAIQQPPMYETTTSVQVESRYFKEVDIIENRNLPPFELFALLELPIAYCNIICNSNLPDNRCCAATGVSTSGEGNSTLGTAYYCIPADYDTSIFESVIDITRPLPSGNVDEIYFMTGEEVSLGKLDPVLVLSRDSVSSKLTMVTETGQLLTLLETRDKENTDSTQLFGDLSFLEDVWVLPSSSRRATVVVYVTGLQYTQTDMPATKQCLQYVFAPSFDRIDFLARDILRRNCLRPGDEIIPAHRIHLCLNTDCSDIVIVPTDHSGVNTVQRGTFDITTDLFTETAVYTGANSNSLSVGNIININKNQALYRTQQHQVRQAFRHPSLWAIDRWGEDDSFDFLLTNPPNTRIDVTSWISNIRLQLKEGGFFEAYKKDSTLRRETLKIAIDCSINNCIGCQSNPPQAKYTDLQAKCFIAQECGVARCAGTMVNLRKPLCNLGKVLVTPYDVYRVALQGAWVSISSNIIMIVELSAERRGRYEVKWQDEVFTAAVCNAKDVLTEITATVTSMVGGLDFVRERAHRDGTFMRGFQIDPRYHARVIMAVGALTNLINSIFLAPLYALIVTQQTVMCSANDTIVTLQQTVTGSEDHAIQIGSKLLSDARSGVVGTCLSKSVGSVLQEIDSPSSTSVGLGYRVSDILTRWGQLTNWIAFEPYAHSIDGLLTWLLGINNGIMDLYQTIDWYHCKVPVARMQDVSKCVCGDVPYSIARARKSGTAETFDFWCSGPLIFTSTLEEDMIIWNPYSLNELLSVPGLEEYIACLGSAANCVRPDTSVYAQVLERQGVEILQVITRCRANFREKKWDDGILVVSQFSVTQWANAHQFGLIVDSTQQNAFSSMGLKIMKLGQSGIIGPLQLPVDLWTCLSNAATAVNWNHKCLELAIQIEEGQISREQYFMYTPATSDIFQHRDACKSYSGLVSGFSTSNSAAHAGIIWSPNSRNSLPVASYHFSEQDSVSARIQAAEEALNSLFENTILPYLRTVQSSIQVSEIETEAWTLEGDNLHQLMDCVVMGPYSAADLHSSFRMTDNKPFPVPQYHRGSPTSRDFVSTTSTQGSTSRRQIIAAAKEALSVEATNEVISQAQDVILRLKTKYKTIDNLKCTCEDSGTSGILASVACCMTYDSLDEITFPNQDALNEDWNLASDVLGGIFESILESDLLTTHLWASNAFTGHAERNFTQAELYELHHAFMFDFEKPVREYSTNEVMKEMRSSSLWHQCTALLSATFFTMPLKMATETVDADTNYDPTAEPVSEAEGNRYSHAIEKAVEQILSKSRETSPHFWSHIHRYVPSDSVWCEQSMPQTYSPPSNSFSPLLWEDGGIDFAQDTILSPRVGEIQYTGSMGCLCGWMDAGRSQCLTTWGDTNDCWDADTGDNATDVAWHTLCAEGIVSSREDYFLMMRVMEYGQNEVWMPSCEDSLPSTSWGLADPYTLSDWYLNDIIPDINLYELANQGPSGLRIGLLGSEANSLSDYVKEQKTMRRESDSQANYHWKHTVAQPICISSVASILSQELNHHFKDTFFPMAHSIHDSPTSAYCSRYATEVAILKILLTMNETKSMPEQLEQEERVLMWRQRCLAQLQQVGICELRGVYDLRPPVWEISATPENRPKCDFLWEEDESSARYHGCSRFFYVTDSCLVYCQTESQNQGSFYDPCLCVSGACGSSTQFYFTWNGCQAAKHTDIRHFAKDTAVRLQSMHWPPQISYDEASEDTQTQQDMESLIQDLPTGYEAMDEDSLLKSFAHVVATQMKQSSDLSNEGRHAPHAYCDDLLDYWDPDSQHPVGYHPTTACACRNTNMRGFTSWMSAGGPDGSKPWRIDPRRLRNMTQYSTTYGSAHSTCDRSVYGKEGVMLNPFYLETKWNSKAKADPTAPIKTSRPASSNGFDLTGVNSQAEDPLSQFDTFIQVGVHSTGLIRNLYRSYNPTKQNDLNAYWPHTDNNMYEKYALRDNAQGDTSGCALPLLRTCSSSVDCQSAVSLVCLVAYTNEFGQDVGICAESGTCFQHRHCPDDLLCSGTGACVAPRIYFHNHMSTDINIQLYSRDSCSQDTWGLSEEQNVPNFARDHGMCKFRDWFHYQLAIDNLPLPRNNLMSLEDRAIRYTDDSTTDSQTLFQRGFLNLDSHPCDRSYAHTRYKACAAEMPGFRGFNTDSPLQHSKGFRTWRQDNVTKSTPVCYMIDNQNKPVSGFLYPYEHIPIDRGWLDTLAYTKDEIAPCVDFGICFDPTFSMEGLSDASLKRQVLTVSYDESQGIIEQFSGLSRTYTHHDAETCFAFGYVVSLASVTMCVVDRYVNPLLDVLFSDLQNHVPIIVSQYDGLSGVRNIMLTQQFNTLQTHCPNAFNNDLEAFKSIFYQTTQLYLPENKAAMADVLNTLLLQIFTDPASTITSLDQYITKSRCAQYIYKSLNKVKTLALRPTESPYAYLDANNPPAPGRALYFFHERATVQTSLEWFWKCVVVASNGNGAPSDWLLRVGRPGMSGNVQCSNYDETMEERHSENSRLSILQKLESDDFLYDVIDPGESRIENFLRQIETVVAVVLDSLKISAWPDLYCMVSTRPDPSNVLGCLYPMRSDESSSQCWVKYGRDRSGSLQNNIGNIYEKVVDVLMNGNSAELSLQTFQSLVDTGIITEILSDLNAEITSTTNFIPSINFVHINTYLQAAEESLKETHFDALENIDKEEQQLFVQLTNRTLYAEKDANRCSMYQAPSNAIGDAYHLINAEYSTSLDVLPEFIQSLIRTKLTAYIQSQIYFNQDELIYLVLELFLIEIYNSQTFRIGNLHQVIEFGTPTTDFNDELAHAREYNTFMSNHEGPCSESLRMDEETNKQHRQMRECVKELSENSKYIFPPGQEVIHMRVPGSLLLNPFYPTFDMHHPTDFLTDLFKEFTKPTDFICAQRGEKTVALNPYWASNFDFQYGCDTRTVGDRQLGIRAIDAICLPGDGGDQSCSDVFPEYSRVISDPQLMRRECKQNDGQVLTREILSDPLCERRPLEETLCNTRHSTLKGSKGSPVSSLYEYSDITDIEEGLWRQQNTIFRTDRYTPIQEEVLSAMSLLPTDIGGHYLQFMIKADKVYLACADLDEVLPTQMCERPLESWMANIEEYWAVQHDIQRRAWIASRPPSNDYRCPLRWHTAYMDDETDFRTRTPSRERNQIRFQHITTNNFYAHPTVLSTDQITGLSPPEYVSDTHMCSDEEGMASPSCHSHQLLMESLQALRLLPGYKFTDWHMVRKVSANEQEISAQCNSTLDWPHGTYTMSDHTQINRAMLRGSCSVMDRIPYFALRYNQRSSARGSNNKVLPGANSQGGVCRMGRLTRIEDIIMSSEWHDSSTDYATSETSSFPLHSCTQTDTEIQCSGWDLESNKIWTDIRQKMPPRPNNLIKTNFRPRNLCSSCESHEEQTVIDLLNIERKSSSIPTNLRQLSVGKPVVFSAERHLANHLRRISCTSPASATCDAKMEKLTTELQLDWRLNYLADSVFTYVTSAAGSPDTTAISDEALWSRPWVFCDQSRDLPKGQKRCSGSITKEDWVNPVTRATQCLAESQKKLNDDSIVPIQFCKLSPSTTSLCSAISNWNAEVLSILCRVTGSPECPDFGFYYSPTTYLPVNREFVADTVDTFYSMVAPGTCPALNSEETAANEELLSQCASLSRVYITTILESARKIVNQVVELIYYATQVVFQMIKILIMVLAGTLGSGVEFLQREANILFKFLALFFEHLGELWAIFGEMLFKLIFDIGIGEIVMNILAALCDFMNTLDRIFIKGVWCPFTRIFLQWVEDVAGLFGLRPPSFWSTIGTTGMCASDHVAYDCEIFSNYDQYLPNQTILPVASRCWSTYTTFFGDSGPLSCSAGDTCLLSPLSSTRVKCAMCPKLDGNFFQFGCHSALKTCACGIPRQESSRCASNVECSHEDVSCNYIDTDMALSSQSVPCDLCSSSPICFIPTGESSGKCGCPLVDMPFGKCLASEHRSTVMPSQFKSLCFLDTDERNSRSLQGAADVSLLVTLPCTSLVPAFSFCTQVFQNMLSTGFYIVGFEQIHTSGLGRRLLTTGDSNQTSTTWHKQINLEAISSVSTLCRDAVREHQLGQNITFLNFTYIECLSQRRYSVELSAFMYQKYNMSIPLCTFCSVADFVQSYPLLHGLNVSMWIDLLLQQEYTQTVLTYVKQHSKILRVIRHDIEGHTLNSLQQIFPDQDNLRTKYASFFMDLPLTMNQQSSSKSSSRHLLSVDQISQYFENLQVSIMDDSLTSSYEELLRVVWKSRLPPLSQEQIFKWQLQWPPKYSTDMPTGRCDWTFSWIQLLQEAAKSVPAAKQRQIRRTQICTNVQLALNQTDNLCRPPSILANSWPKLLNSSGVFLGPKKYETTSIFLTSLILDASFELLKIIGISSKGIKDFVYSSIMQIKSNFRCDLETVQECSEWRVNILMGTLVIFVIYSFAFLICNFFGIVLIPILMLPFFPFFVLQLCYGYSLFCIPTIPTCLIYDTRIALQSFFPSQLIFPQSLTANTPTCIGAQNLISISSDCILSCQDEPFNYDSWEPVAAWLAAEVGLTDLLLENLTIIRWIGVIDTARFEQSLGLQRAELQQQGDTMWAHRICSLLNSYRILPYLFVIVVSVLLVQTIMRFLLTLLLSLVAVVSKVGVYATTPQRESIQS